MVVTRYLESGDEAFRHEAEIAAKTVSRNAWKDEVVAAARAAEIAATTDFPAYVARDAANTAAVALAFSAGSLQWEITRGAEKIAQLADLQTRIEALAPIQKDQ